MKQNHMKILSQWYIFSVWWKTFNSKIQEILLVNKFSENTRWNELEHKLSKIFQINSKVFGNCSEEMRFLPKKKKFFESTYQVLRAIRPPAPSSPLREGVVCLALRTVRDHIKAACWSELWENDSPVSTHASFVTPQPIYVDGTPFPAPPTRRYYSATIQYP